MTSLEFLDEYDNDEFYIYVNHEGVSCETSINYLDKYKNVEADAILVSVNAGNKILESLDSDELYSFQIAEDELLHNYFLDSDTYAEDNEELN